MPGAFDDLIPRRSEPAGGRFSDLVPAGSQTGAEVIPEERSAEKRSAPSSSVGRSAGLTLRSALQGLSDLVYMPFDALAEVYNYVQSRREPYEVTLADGRKVMRTGQIPTASEQRDEGLDAAGLPRPETPLERTANFATRAAVGAGGVATAARAGTGAVATALAERPGLQMVSGATGGAAANVAGEMGAPPLVQLLAGIAGAAAPSGLMRQPAPARASSRRTTAGAADPDQSSAPPTVPKAQAAAAAADAPGAPSIRSEGARPEAFVNAELPTGVQPRAGTIRLDKLETTDDVRRTITETAEQFAPQLDDARRGRVSDADTRQLADALAMTPDDLLKRRRGQAFNAEEALAARQLLVTSADDLAAKAKAAIGGSDDGLLAFRQALERHGGIQAQIAGMTAEAGRALRQFRIPAGGARERAMKEAIESFGGRDKLEELAERMATIDTPEGITKFAREATQATTSDKLLEVWINSLLSGPQTHVVNALSNTLTAAWTLPEHLLASGIGAFARKADRVYAREVAARAFGAVQGIRDGLRAARRTWLTEEPSDLLSKIEASRHQAIPSVTLRRGAPKAKLFGVPIPFSGEVTLGGRQVRIPGRALQASDEFFKAVGYRMELNARAVRDGLSKRLKGRELAEHVDGLIRDPPPGISMAAIDNARYQTFTKPLGAIGKGLSQIAAKHPALRIVVPFIRTPTNILKFAVERSPFGLLMREVRDNLRAGGATRDIQLARLAFGSGIGALVAQLATEGHITGAGPSDRIAQSALRDTGWQPYSVKIGDRYTSFSRLEPLGMLLGVSADLAEISGEIDEGEIDGIAGRIVASITQNLTSKTYLRGLSELVEAIHDPDRYGEGYIQSLAGTLVPTGVAQVARTEDPVLRDAQSVMDRLKSRIPGYSTTLPARRNIWGEPLVLSGGLGPDLISPLYSSVDRNDPVSEEFARLNVRIGMPDRTVRDRKLTPHEHSDYVEASGQAAKLVLERVITDPGYAALPDDARRELFERTIRRTRAAVRSRLSVGLPAQSAPSTTTRPSSGAAPASRVPARPDWAGPEVPPDALGGAQLDPGYEYDVEFDDGRRSTIRLAPDGRIYEVAREKIGRARPEAARLPRALHAAIRRARGAFDEQRNVAKRDLRELAGHDDATLARAGLAPAEIAQVRTQAAIERTLADARTRSARNPRNEGGDYSVAGEGPVLPGALRHGRDDSPQIPGTASPGRLEQTLADARKRAARDPYQNAGDYSLVG